MIRRTKSLGWWLALLAFGGCPFPAPLKAQAADSAEVEARVKVAFVYNFARFVEWPDAQGHQPIRIAVVGRGDLASPLEEVTKGKTVNGRAIEVVRLAGTAAIPRCDILLVERSEAKHVKNIVQPLASKPVLTVCDGSNCLKDGAMIGFQLVEESVRFQINQEIAEKAGLKVSSQLLKVALPITGDKQ